MRQLLAEANALVPRLSVREAQDLILGGNALLIDVREHAELAITGKLKGAAHLPMHQLADSASEGLPCGQALGKDRPVILYCAHGIRSALAGYRLRRMGYERVYNLGGFEECVTAGFEMEPYRT